MKAITPGHAAQIEQLAKTEDGRQQLTLMAVEPLLHYTNRGRLPERIFRQMFLPFFLGNVEETEDRPYTREWIRVAGGPTSEVEVFSEVDQSVLFIVPALYDSANLNIQFGTVVRKFVDWVQDFQAINPIVANNQITKTFGEIGQIAASNYDNTQSVERWNKILDYYDIARPNTNQSSGQNGAAGSDDGYEFY